jgi:hypothetical protein
MSDTILEPRTGPDDRHHVQSMLMRESLLDKQVMASTESDVVRMLPDVHVVKVGGSSILDQGRAVTYPVVATIGELLKGGSKLILGVGGGVRSRHVFSIGIDLGLPTGVLAQVSVADALGNAHILGRCCRRTGWWPSRRRSLATCCRCSSTARRASSLTACRRTRCGSIRRRSAASPRTARTPAA